MLLSQSVYLKNDGGLIRSDADFDWKSEKQVEIITKHSSASLRGLFLSFHMKRNRWSTKAISTLTASVQEGRLLGIDPQDSGFILFNFSISTNAKHGKKSGNTKGDP